LSFPFFLFRLYSPFVLPFVNLASTTPSGTNPLPPRGPDPGCHPPVPDFFPGFFLISSLPFFEPCVVGFEEIPQEFHASVSHGFDSFHFFKLIFFSLFDCLFALASPVSERASFFACGKSVHHPFCSFLNPFSPARLFFISPFPFFLFPGFVRLQQETLHPTFSVPISGVPLLLLP